MTARIPDPAEGLPLERAELFRKLPAETLDRLRPVLRERRFARHDAVFREGQEAEFLWVLRTGSVRLYKSSPSGRVATLETLAPGELFGALDLGAHYPADAEAQTDASAWCVPRRVVERLVVEHPELALEILAIASRRLRQAHERLRSFAHDRVPRRLARALLESAREGDVPLTRADLAEAAGTTVETAIRVLRRFERQGLIRGEVGLVHLLDAAGLRRIAGDE